MMSEVVIPAPPMKRVEIRAVARKIRELNSHLTGLDKPFFPIFEFLEVTLPRHFEEFSLEIVEKEILGSAHGLTFPDENRIQIRKDVYKRARQGQGRDRMTMAHELGHLVLHANLGLARRMQTAGSIPTYESSEWQAKALAGELLISVDHVHLCRTAEEAALMFGVSLDAARHQWNVFEREGLIRKR
jgi:hypothetical protein